MSMPVTSFSIWMASARSSVTRRYTRMRDLRFVGTLRLGGALFLLEEAPELKKLAFGRDCLCRHG